MSEKNILLETKHLSKHFSIRSSGLFQPHRTLYALEDVTLQLREGETLGVIGESGCGKSTLGRTIVGLYSPTSGEVCYDGQVISGRRQRQEICKNIQMVFQDPYSSLNPKIPCGELVEEPLRIHRLCESKREREKRVQGLLEEVGLGAQHMYRYPHEFSGGQRQRINIARALALDPKVIVCDEPVSALDVSIQAQVLNLLIRLQRERKLAYLFISHDLGVISHISDRVAIMYLGSVVELCRAEDIHRNPLHPYTQALLSAIPPNSPFESKERIELTGTVPSPIGKRAGCALAQRCPYCGERCRREAPKLTLAQDGHYVSCFRKS